MLVDADRTEAIVFDLDGTLYVNRQLLTEIEWTAELLVAQGHGIVRGEARRMIAAARKRLADPDDREPPLSRVCMELGVDLKELHRAFEEFVRPERYLVYDPVLHALLDSLCDRCALYIYTNNNLAMTHKILALLGVEELFDKLYTIEFCWRPKPDPEALQLVLEDIGGPPERLLFVGDRYQVDLEPALEHGIPTLLVNETADLLQVHKLLGLLP